MNYSTNLSIIVGARKSPLSQTQWKEFTKEIGSHYPNLTFTPKFLDTLGDKNKKKSLRELKKCDFFTYELDQSLLKGECRITVHSAKDLPDPLANGLHLAAITKGLDPRDVLVLRKDQRIENLREGAVIATSSPHREEAVKALRNDLSFTDLRGTIHERLSLLDSGEVEGVVVAFAALIRLDLLHVNYHFLPGETTPLQGQLAILCKEEDNEMKNLLSVIDVREKSTLLRT